ncbi:N-acetylmannosamine kinase [Aeromonas sp. 102P]|uniref:N-acetylmannosamine kinase n=1 Tax=Aeromonas sp. 102P TaxID=3452711 RepID=UPI003F7A3D66
MSILTIDIGGTKLAAALADEQGVLQQRMEIKTPASQDPDAMSLALAAIITPYLGQASRVAVASTGIIKNGMLNALNPDNLGGLNNFPISNTIAEISGLPCSVINDAQAATWAEYLAQDKQVSEMAFITISTGVGGGLVINNRLHMGVGAFAGHIGHMSVSNNETACGCGRIGCVESIASGRAIAARASNDLAGLDAKAIFAKAEGGHLQAQQLIRDSAQTIAQLIANLRACLDIQSFVLGGSIGLAAGYLDQVNVFLNTYPAPYQANLSLARHQKDAGLIGAALWAMID